MKSLKYALISLIFTIPAAWLSLFSTCTYVDWNWQQVCSTNRVGTWLILLTLGVAALTFAPIGLVYRERARRRASRGMWRRVHGGYDWGRRLSHAVRVAWGSEEGEQADLITGEIRFERRRWLIPVANGQHVYVDRREFWEWLQHVEALAATLPPGHSAIGSRLWRKKLKEGRWLAYCQILDAVGRLRYPTSDARSREYEAGSPWSVVEEYEKIQESQVY